MTNLKGKKVLVTGASGGIGKAIAIELSSNGADLCLTGRNKSELESLQKLLGGNCEIIISDLSKSEGIDELANPRLISERHLSNKLKGDFDRNSVTPVRMKNNVNT